jgi:hypothetical protein
MAGRVFEEVPGYPEGSRFGTRVELSEARLHRPRVAGISGSYVGRLPRSSYSVMRLTLWAEGDEVSNS